MPTQVPNHKFRKQTTFSNCRKSSDPYQMNSLNNPGTYRGKGNGGYSRPSTNRNYYKKGSRSQNPKTKSTNNRFFDFNSSFENVKSEQKINHKRRKVVTEIEVPNFA